MATFIGTNGDDTLIGTDEDDTFTGAGGNDTIIGLGGNDTANFNISVDGSDRIDLGAGADIVNVTASGAAQVRLAFTSSEVGNGNPLDANTSQPLQDGGLAVRMQAEDGSDGLTGPLSRTDDEGITFIAGNPSLTFDVRDLLSGAQRGDAFRVVALGTNGDDVLTGVAGRENEAHYINAGAGNDTVTGGNGDDFLVGGGGNDTLNGGDGNDSFIGGGGNDVINGGAGDDTAIFNVSTDGSDQVDLGAGADVVRVSASGAGQVRLAFTSSEVGNGNPLDSNTSQPLQDGGLAVRMQAEDGSGALTGAISRFDDEGISFEAATAGITFDVRDLLSGAARGDQFDVVHLGTSQNDVFDESGENESYYINAGAGNDTVTGGNGDDFLVGGGGNDILNGGGGNDTFIGGGGNDVINGGAGVDRAILGFTFESANFTFGPEGVTIVGTEGMDTFVGIEEFQFSNRLVSLDDDNKAVDDLFYLAMNPDVAAAGVDPDEHYANGGFLEGRDPNAFFSSTGYYAANPDVAAAGVDPLDHYVNGGFNEGRDPGANFDTEFYLLNNPDVAAAGIDPLTHYLTNGQAEGREIYDAIGRGPALDDGFDANFYLLANTDVAEAALASGGNTADFAFQHYTNGGFNEGRDPNAVFDSSGYLAAYLDVALAGVDPLAHYHNGGYLEGRDPAADFDTTDYYDANPDVAAAGIDPMVHFLQAGLYEGRMAFSDGTFDNGINI